MHKKNVSLDKKIICEEIQNYEFPAETRKNQIIYYLPPEGKGETALTKLTRRREQDDYDGAFPGDNVSGCEYFACLMVRMMTIIWCFYQLKILQWFSGRSLWINSA